MKFRVHSLHYPKDIPVKAKTAAGTEVDATMLGGEVELVPLDEQGKTVTLELHAENYSGMPIAEMFAQDNIVALGFTLIEKAKPKDGGKTK